jgi:hypothetical protein
MTCRETSFASGSGSELPRTVTVPSLATLTGERKLML